MSRSRIDFLTNTGPTVKVCRTCGRRIPLSQPYDQCKDCLKREIFPKVKDFINENYDVNEMIVAQEFGIDRSIVHEWVKEGHLEYKTKPQQ